MRRRHRGEAKRALCPADFHVGDRADVLRSTLAASGGITTSTSPVRIGGNVVFSSPGTEYFAGLIDEVRIYNRALTAAEIAADMSTPLP